MFDTLLETKAGKQRRAGGAALSVAVHAALIAGAVVATGRAEAPPPASPEVVVPIPVPHRDPGPARPSEPKRGDGRMSGGGPILSAPLVITDHIPPIDVGMPAITDPTILGGGLEGPDRVAGPALRHPGEGGNHFAWQVEKPAIAAPNNPAPRYPEILRSAGVEGEVLVQFVVDTAGRAEMSTLKVLRSTHDLFTSAVRASLPATRFLPAESGGRKVRMWVQMPFEFAVR